MRSVAVIEPASGLHAQGWLIWAVAAVACVGTWRVAVARTAARLTVEGKLLSVAGGGDTVAALNHAGVASEFSFVSTAGGAFLEWMEGKDLPGVKALMG